MKYSSYKMWVHTKTSVWMSIACTCHVVRETWSRERSASERREGVARCCAGSGSASLLSPSVKSPTFCCKHTDFSQLRVPEAARTRRTPSNYLHVELWRAYAKNILIAFLILNECAIRWNTRLSLREHKPRDQLWIIILSRIITVQARYKNIHLRHTQKIPRR